MTYSEWIATFRESIAESGVSSGLAIACDYLEENGMYSEPFRLYLSLREQGKSDTQTTVRMWQQISQANEAWDKVTGTNAPNDKIHLGLAWSGRVGPFYTRVSGRASFFYQSIDALSTNPIYSAEINCDAPWASLLENYRIGVINELTLHYVGPQAPPDISKLYGTSLKRLTVLQHRYNKPPRGVIHGQFVVNKHIPKGCELQVRDQQGAKPLVVKKV